MRPPVLHATLALQAEGNFPGRAAVAGWIIARAAEEAHIRKVFGTSRDQKRYRKEGACGECFQLRSANGSCAC